MIPLKDNIPSSTFPVVNISLIILNIAVFLYEVSLGPYLEKVIFLFGVIPNKFLFLLSKETLHPVATFFPLFTSLFLHGGWLHLIGNMLYLWIFGDNVEDRMGHVRYLLFYLLCGIGAGITHIITQPNSHIPTIGASGAIAGVMGAYFILFPKARVVTLIPIFFFIQFIEIPAFFFLAFWFFMQLISGTISGSSQFSGGIAFWAHIGGFICGIILLFFLKRGGGEVTGEHMGKMTWNERYLNTWEGEVREPASFLKENLSKIPKGKALDLAMGVGQNAIFLAVNGYEVVGIDSSQVAIEKAKAYAREKGISIQAIKADLTTYALPEDEYNVILNFYFLERGLIPQIKKALKKGGMVLFETYTMEHKKFDQPFNPNYLLKENELLHLFLDFKIIFYQEGVVEKDGIKKAIASLLAEKVR